MRQWPKNEIGVAVQIWLWLQVELMTCKLSHLERLNEIQWSWDFEISLTPTFYSYFKESVGGEHQIYQLIPLYSYHYLKKTSIKYRWQMKKWNSQNEMWQWIKDQIEVAV